MGTALWLCCGASHYGGFSCCRVQVLGHTNFSCCGAQAPEPRLESSGTLGLLALKHVGSSWIRDRICASCIGRWILNHWITRKVLPSFYLTKMHKLTLGNERESTRKNNSENNSNITHIQFGKYIVLMFSIAGCMRVVSKPILLAVWWKTANFA